MSDSRFTVTVIVCAYTQLRWDDLASAMDSVLAQPEATGIILVIDHESELLTRATAAWSSPRVAVVGNAFRQGLSGARNTGLRLATGDLVAFIDDDAEATEGWLRELVGCFDSPAVVAAGGRAMPGWPSGRRPSVLPPELLWIVGCTYRGQPVVRSDVRNVMGCSMVFRRTALVAIGGFNENMGRVGLVPLGDEETEVCIKLRQTSPGSRVVFEPRSVVMHRVTPERVTWRYLRRRSFFEGVSKAALSKGLGSRDALSSERGYVRRVLPAGVWRELSRGSLAAALAILLSLVSAGFGYLYGSTFKRSGNSRLHPTTDRTAAR